MCGCSGVRDGWAEISVMCPTVWCQSSLRSHGSEEDDVRTALQSEGDSESVFASAVPCNAALVRRVPPAFRPHSLALECLTHLSTCVQSMRASHDQTGTSSQIKATLPWGDRVQKCTYLTHHHKFDEIYMKLIVVLLT